MTDRAIFNKRYTGFTPGTTQVWLANGAGVTTTLPSSQDFIAGQTLSQGTVVYVSGQYVLSASAASGVAATQASAIGITSSSAVAGSGVNVILDDIAILNNANIASESSLTPGEYYYLSKYTGQVTKYSTSSGVVSAASGYAYLVSLGTAISSSELHVEVQPAIQLFDTFSPTQVTPAVTQTLTAGVNLIKGAVVYVSGVYALPATAASGTSSEKYSVIGVTDEAASATLPVEVVLDDVVTISSVNIAGATSLVPGQYYYLSRYEGQLTPYTTASGIITRASGYAALVNLGIALSTNELKVQLQQPLELYS